MAYARLDQEVVVEYPLSAGEIKKRFLSTSFANPFTPPAGLVEVAPAERPSVAWNENVQEVAPLKIGGVWTQVWTVVPASQAEIDARLAAKAQSVRADRDRRLRDSDWTQFGDATVDTAAWATYRQALRDVPAQPGFPLDVTWPTPPDTSAPGPDWRGFLAAVRQTSVFTQLRGSARADVAANALATELRTVLGEAALGMAEPAVVQGLLDELAPSLDAGQKSELSALFTTYRIPLALAP